jgi:hypothetical protein
MQRRQDLAQTDIDTVWESVAADFASFNVDVTTDGGRYWTTLPGHRMRCIITPSRGLAPVAGGIALVGSFWLSGNELSATVPCWPLRCRIAVICADVISHEFGHTFGLLHDGRTQPPEEYYAGHDAAAMLGPIMGAPIMKESSSGVAVNIPCQQL